MAGPGIEASEKPSSRTRLASRALQGAVMASFGLGFRV